MLSRLTKLWRSLLRPEPFRRDLPAADGSGPRYLFYQVCPFGANFSALWFQRLGSFFLRVLRGRNQGNVMHQATQHKKTMLGTVETLVLTRCKADIVHEPQGWDDVEEEVD